MKMARKNKKSDNEWKIVIGAIIILSLVFLWNQGYLQSVATVGGISQYKVGEEVKVSYTMGANEWTYINANGMTCDDMKGNMFVFIQRQGDIVYRFDGTSTAGGAYCQGYPSGAILCTAKLSFDYVAQCKSKSSSVGRLDSFYPKVTGSYNTSIDFISSTKNKQIFPLASVARQSVAFTVIPAPTPTPCPAGTVNLGALGCQTIQPTSGQCPAGQYWEAPSNSCKPSIPTSLPTQQPTSTPIPTTTCSQTGEVCGVDGITYPNECTAIKEAGGIQSVGACLPVQPPTATPPIVTDCKTSGCNEGFACKLSGLDQYSCQAKEELPIIEAPQCEFYQSLNKKTYKCDPNYILIGIGVMFVLFIGYVAINEMTKKRRR